MTSKNVRIISGVILAGGLLAGSFASNFKLTAQQAGAWTPTIVTIPSPAAANAGEPQLTVSGRGVLLSWIEHTDATTSLRFAERTQTGWTEPRTVASGDDWSVNPIDVPSVLRLSNGALVAQWLQQSGSGMHANDVWLSYSKNEGKTWARSFTPYHDGTPRERLFASLFEMPNATLGLIWLSGGTTGPTTTDRRRRDSDHERDADHIHQQDPAHQGHQGHEGRGAAGSMGDMSLRFAAFDGAWKQTADMAIDSRVCECCSTAAVVTSEGVLAAYRNRSDDDPSTLRQAQGRPEQSRGTTSSGSPRAESRGEIRDIYVSRLVLVRGASPRRPPLHARSRGPQAPLRSHGSLAAARSRFSFGRWSEPSVVHADNWRIPACPINGPALSASGRNVVIAWYTVEQDQGHAYLAFSSDAGHTFSEPIRLDENASLGRVDVELLPDGSALATWIEFADGRSQFRARSVSRDGARSPAVTIAGLAGGRAGGAPRVARHGDELVFAWADGGTSQVRTASARLPSSALR